MEENNLSVNNVEVAEPQENIDVNSTENVEETSFLEPTETKNVEAQEEVVNPQGEESNPVQTKEENAAFARARREFEAKQDSIVQNAKDDLIASFNMEWNGKKITTEAEYQQALYEKNIVEQAQQRNQDPLIALEMQQMKDKLAKQEFVANNLKQEDFLTKDENHSVIFNQYNTRIRDLQNQLNQANPGEYFDLQTSYMLFIYQNIGEIIKGISTNAQNEAIKNVNANNTVSPGNLSSQVPINTTKSFKDMTSEEFEEFNKRMGY